MKLIIKIFFIFIFCNIQAEQSVNFEFAKSQSIYSEYFKNIPAQKGNGYKPYKRWENFYEKRNDIPLGINLLKELEQFKNNKTLDNLQLSSDWKSLGPNYVPKNKLPYKSSGNGRINCLAFDPLYTNVVWAGSASGGIWKSNDGGASWITFPFTQFLSIGISDIAINPKDPKVVYAATGDADGSFMTRGYTIGVIKTTDGGYNWQVTNFQNQIHDNILISKIVINPDFPETILVSTSLGIFKSTDGGNNWLNKLSNLNIRDLVISADNPNVLFASSFNSSGNTAIFKSIDGGDNWTKKYDLPKANRSAIGISKSNPNMIYLVASNINTNSLNGFYNSTDKGESWNLLTDAPNLLSQAYLGDDNIGQGNYDLCIAIHPTNSAEIWVGGINIWKSSNGGVLWQIATHWSGDGGAQFAHADHHDLVFDKNNYLYSANDGGIFNTQNNGKNWFDVTKNICATQVYRFDIDQTNTKRMIIGCQDNGTLNLVNGTFEHVTGGDGMDCKLDTQRDSVFYNSVYYGTIYKTDGKNSNLTIFNTEMSKEQSEWTAPIKLNPKNSGILYVGHNNLWRSDDSNQNFYKISNFSDGVIHNIEISKIDTSIIYVSSGKSIFKTIKGGKSWNKIYTSPQSNISSININDKNPNIIYISTTGYNNTEKVLELNNGIITNLSKNLPNVPINCIIHQNNTQRRIYAGTDIGVFVYNNESWELFNTNMPNLVINDLKINELTGKLYAGSFGRGIWETNISSCPEFNATFSILGDTVLCEPQTLSLILDQKWNNIQWSDSSKLESIKISKSGIYSAVVETAEGCSYKTRSVRVTINPLPKLRIFTDKSEFCEGTGVEVFATAGFEKYRWSNFDTTYKILIDKPGKVFCFGITDKGCSIYSDTLDFKMLQRPAKPIIIRQVNNLIAPKSFKYLWYLDSKEIQGATNQEYKIDKMGNFQVEVFDTNDCSNISDMFSVVTDVDDILNTKVNIYYNKDTYELSINNFNDYEIQLILFDYLGRSITNQVIQNNLTINLNDFSNGVYYLKINSLDFGIQKIIIK
jgi:photosystem II stability/assembly factor-like uncharacterized protein